MTVNWVTKWLVALCAAIAVIGVGLWTLPLAQYPRGERSDLRVLSSPVVQAVSFEPLQVSASLEWSPEHSIVSPQVQGVVTSVLVSPHTKLSCGSPVMSINGKPMVAWCGRFPLWRSLDVGSVGLDADDARRVLTAMGILPEGSALTAAVIDRFLRDVGLPQEGRLDPASLIWIGDGALTPDTVPIIVGQQVMGSVEVLHVDSHLISASVRVPGLGSSRRIFRPLGTDISVPIALDGALANLSELEALDHGSAQSGLPLTMPGNALLVDGIPGVAVPASAIVTDGSRTCVERVLNDGGTQAVAVSVLESQVQGVIVTSKLADGDSVRTAPSSDARC